MPERVTGCAILLMELHFTPKSSLKCEADIPWTLSHFKTPQRYICITLSYKSEHLECKVAMR